MVFGILLWRRGNVKGNVKIFLNVTRDTPFGALLSAICPQLAFGSALIILIAICKSN